MIYLDWAATAIPQKEILEKCLKESINLYGNPSSTHSEGINAKATLNECRDLCADLLNCNCEDLYFTSGGTEANNTVLLSFLNKHSSGEIITTTLEHPSNFEPLNILKKFGWKIKNINPDEYGLIQTKKIIKSITDKTKVISLIHVHNETGVIQPIKDIVSSIREKEKEIGKKIHVHIDGIQAAGKIDLDLSDLNIDSYSISGHKFGAIKGVGLLYLRNHRDVLYRGGGQERGVRPGTENLFGIMTLAECLKSAIADLDSEFRRVEDLMTKLIIGIREIGIDTIPKSRSPKDNYFIPNILSLTSPPLPGEVLARVLNEKGYMISTGSACSSNKKSNTSGLLSMGISKDEGFSSFRVSIGRTTTLQDIDDFLTALKETKTELLK